MTIYRDQIEAVYALLEDEKRWTQGAYARNSDGRPVELEDPNAACWCLRGAFLKTTSLFGVSLCGTLDVTSVIDFNDAPDRTHPEVLALLKSAIERAPVRP